jgi:hypothetical protein
LVTIDHGEITMTTTAGTKITIPASSATLAKFVDDLANHVEKQFRFNRWHCGQLGLALV